jgi:hypothetical protein
MAKQRFLKSIIATSKTDLPALPWARKRAEKMVRIDKPVVPQRKLA